MEKLANEISEKAGITPEQARVAVDHTAAWLKARLPHVFHRQLDNLLDGGTLNEGLRKKFNEMKDDFEAAARNFGKRAEDIAGDVKKKMDDIFNK